VSWVVRSTQVSPKDVRPDGSARFGSGYRRVTSI
jgi:hypothetical protein